MTAAPQHQPRPQYQARPVAQSQGGQRNSRNDIYLPPMPEMLQSRNPSSASAPPRYAQNDPSRAPKPEPARNPKTETRNEPAVVRGQAPDDGGRNQPNTRVSLPTPEQLGLINSGEAEANRALIAGNTASRPASGSSQKATLDWTEARQRLDRIGASAYRLEKVADGGFRFTCTLPYPQSQTQERQFEAQATGEAQAVELVLRQAERWSAQCEGPTAKR
jgi:hypothetical protein